MQGLAKTAGRPGAVDLVDVPDPEPGPGEALVEVAHAGLCGSDLGVYHFEDAFDFMTFPTVLGHEYAGTVTAVGDRVDRLAVGDRVVGDAIVSCGECYQCLAGQPNVCANAQITGIHFHGAFAPRAAIPARNLHAVPDGLSLRDAAITEPTAVAVRAIARNARVGPGTSVLVEGPGPIGLLAAQVAREAGGDVVVTGVDQDESVRLPLARDLGFETANVAADDLAAVVESATGGVGFDVVVDATGHGSGLASAADAVRKGGQVVLVGLTDRTDASFTPLVRGEVDLQCSYAYDWRDVETALDLIASGGVAVEGFVDESYSLAEGERAFEDVAAGEAVKPLFDCSDL